MSLKNRKKNLQIIYMVTVYSPEYSINLCKLISGKQSKILNSFQCTKLSPCNSLYSILYLYQHGLRNAYFIPWVIIKNFYYVFGFSEVFASNAVLNEIFFFLLSFSHCTLLVIEIQLILCAYLELLNYDEFV